MDLIKVLRLRTMLETLRGEVRDIQANEASLRRLAVVHNEIESQLAAALPSFKAELAEFSSCCHDSPHPSKPEIRVAQAQLIGWIEGLLQGVQLTMATARSDGAGPSPSGPVDEVDEAKGYNPNTYL